ncbi:MAG: hypothetical protein ACRD1K_19965 [Acidimicrobiales bacterium]
MGPVAGLVVLAGATLPLPDLIVKQLDCLARVAPPQMPADQAAAARSSWECTTIDFFSTCQ